MGKRKVQGTGNKPILAEVDISDRVFWELLWLSDAELPPGITVETGRVNWSRLIPLAYDQRLLSILHTRIAAHLAQSHEYAHLVSLLKAAQLENAKRSLALAAETLRVLDVLEQFGIPAIAFKGCILSWIVYGNLSARKAGDIDILVKKSDVCRAAKILTDCGYQPFRKRNGAEMRILFDLDCEWELANRQMSLGLDLHWKFNASNSGLFLPMDRIWSRRQSLMFCGRPISNLAREDLILMLCIHATKHHLQILEWIYTLARAVNECAEVDWALIRREADCAQATRLLNLGLLMADELYGIALPENIRAEIHADRKARDLAIRTLPWMLCGSQYLPPRRAVRQYHFDTRVGMLAKARYLLHASFTPTARDYIWDLPRTLHWCYYIIRGLRLLGEMIGRFFAGKPEKTERHVVQWIPDPEILRVIQSATSNNHR